MDPGFQLTPAEKHTEIGVFGCLSVCDLISCKSCSIIILLLLSALPVLVGSPDHSVSVVQRYVVGLLTYRSWVQLPVHVLSGT